jgi:tripartite-type tricarboxylate transporter receptor subunit TctC
MHICFRKIALTPFLLLALAGGAWAQDYPSKTIRFVVPFPPGGSSDLISRAVTQHLAQSLGQPVVVENRPGAGGMLGVDQVAKAAPDGYTIGLAAAGALSSNVSLYPKMPFDPQKDLEPVSMLAMIPFFLVASMSMPPTLKEVLELAKSKDLSYGHGGNGSTMHLAGELLNMMAHVKIQPVPYKGSGPVSADVLGGQVPLGVVDVPSAISAVKAGKMRALAVTSKKRIEAAPEVPTFEEAGVPGYEAIGWFGVVAPKGTPKPIVAKLNTEIARALADPDIRRRAIAAGTEPLVDSPEEFAGLIREETKKWAEVIKQGGIRLQ